MGKLVGGVLSAFILAVATGGVGLAEEPKPPAQPALKVGQLAPTFLLKALNPDKGGMALFSTKKVMGAKAKDRRQAVVMSFGASYCGPCKKELPELHKIAKRYRDKGVLIVEIIVDKEPEGLESMRKFTMEELGLTFPVLHDRFGIVGRKYGAVELPHLVVLDGDKVVRWMHSGFTPDTMKKLAKTLDGVLAAGQPTKVNTPQKGR
ncbi:MAG: TlpA disulfide reductase family protein [Myxococcota bacterium]|nr:TlpA disulfide reductase family protein [Myxococcota bacterium]